jgi:hypothetical protein
MSKEGNFDFEISPSSIAQRELGERKEWEDEGQRWGLVTLRRKCKEERR